MTSLFLMDDLIAMPSISKRLWLLVCVMMFNTFSATDGPPLLLAEEILSVGKSRHGSELRSLFAPIVSQVQGYNWEVSINDATTVPGTLVESSRGWLVIKASETAEFVDPQDRFVCKTEPGIERTARLLKVELSHDLVLLEIEGAGESPLPDVQPTKKLIPGQWVISVGSARSEPLGVGVLGALPRDIESSNGYIGLNVEESDRGLRVTQVYANSGSARAGFRKGDYILKSPNQPAEKRGWLTKIINGYEPGDYLQLLVDREGELLTLDLQVGVNWDSLIDRQAIMNRFGSDVSLRKSGFASVIQHDTLLHPRDCGTPLVNLKGELVGVNIARAGRTDTYAIPLEVILQSFLDATKQ